MRLASDEGALNPGEAVDVEVSASRLRRAASRAYGIAIVAIVLGAGFGHLVGARWGLANLGAFLGLLVGTFSAGRLTKHLDASPPLRVRACLESRSESPERQR